MQVPDALFELLLMIFGNKTSLVANEIKKNKKIKVEKEREREREREREGEKMRGRENKRER